ncbi:DUF3987 domain-containing protein [Spirosoma daeguense]
MNITEDLKANVAANAQRLKQGEQPNVGPFPIAIFPKLLQRVIDQTARHLQYRTEWIATSILYAASVATGNSIGTKYNNWPQKATLYLAIVGMPGTNKSGPPEYALKPLRQLNAEYYKRYKEEKAEYDRWENLSKTERKNQGLPTMMYPPFYHTLLVSDVTPEGLAQTHQNNPVGLGLFMDELAGWFQNFNRYQKGSEQEFWLSNWSFSPVSIIRKTTAPILIDQPFISIAGTIQPGVLGELAKDRRNQNGFIDRILFAYPDEQTTPYDADSSLNSAITDDYRICIKKLLGLRESVTNDENGNPQTRWLPFAPDAFTAMRNWKNASTDRRNQSDNPALKGLYAKLEAYCIRFALLIELLDWTCRDSDLTHIQLSSVERAIELTAYFQANAEKVYYVLNEQSAAERLPREQQRLFNGMPDEVNTADAIEMGIKMMPPISKRTVMRLLRNPLVFKRIGRGEYEKCC